MTGTHCYKTPAPLEEALEQRLRSTVGNAAHRCDRCRRPRGRGALGLAGMEIPGEVAYPWGMDGAITRITADPSVCSGQPCVRGLRITVALVLKYLAAGRTPAVVVEEFPELEVEDVRDCLRYAAWLASGRTLILPSAA